LKKKNNKSPYSYSLELKKTIQSAHKENIHHIEIDYNGRYLLSSTIGQSTFVYLYSLNSNNNDNSKMDEVSIDFFKNHQLSLSSNSEYFSIGTVMKSLKIWKINFIKPTKKQLKEYNISAMSGDSQFAFYDKIEKYAFIPNAHNLSITSVMFTNDSRYLISGSHDGEMKLWDLYIENFVDKQPKCVCQCYIPNQTNIQNIQISIQNIVAILTEKCKILLYSIKNLNANNKNINNNNVNNVENEKKRNQI